MTSREEQFSLIYDQYIEKIYRFVYVKVSSREIAEDVTSKVFLKGWEAYRGGQDIKNPGAFLYQIARNALVDSYREKDKKGTVPMGSVAQIPDKAENVYEKAAFDSDIESIRLAIKNLDKDHQDIIIWYYLEDMSSKQIAELLDRPEGTVRVMIHRALEALKYELGH